MKKVLLAGFLILAISSMAQVDLLFMPKKGSSKKITHITNMVMEMNIGDKKMSMPIYMEQYYQATVTQVGDSGKVTMEYKLTKVVMDAEDPKTKRKMHYDSDKIEDTEEYKKMDEKFRPKIGAVSTCLYNNKATLLSYEGEKTQMEEIWIKYPTKKVKVNDTWTDTFSKDESGIKISGTTTYKVIEISKTQAVVEGSTTGTLFPKPMKSLTYIDLSTGLQTSSSSEGIMDLQMMTMSMKVEMKVE